MSNILFCFSGTGNSLSIAKEVANKVSNTKLILIADVRNESIDLKSYERVGFVFPAYFGKLPPIVEDFIQKLYFYEHNYIFSIVTAGARQGNAANDLAYYINKNNGTLKLNYNLSMPGNYIVMYGAWPKFIQDIQLKNIQKKKDVIVGSIKIKKENVKLSNGKKPKSLIEIMPDLSEFAKDYLVNENCTACQTCVKVCPMANISMLNGKPVFGDECTKCMACIQWCTEHAIEYKDKTQKRTRYHHPDIKAIDLYKSQ